MNLDAGLTDTLYVEQDPERKPDPIKPVAERELGLDKRPEGSPEVHLRPPDGVKPEVSPAPAAFPPGDPSDPESRSKIGGIPLRDVKRNLGIEVNGENCRVALGKIQVEGPASLHRKGRRPDSERTSEGNIVDVSHVCRQARPDLKSSLLRLGMDGAC